MSINRVKKFLHHNPKASEYEMMIPFSKKIYNKSFVGQPYDFISLYNTTLNIPALIWFSLYPFCRKMTHKKRKDHKNGRVRWSHYRF